MLVVIVVVSQSMNIIIVVEQTDQRQLQAWGATAMDTVKIGTASTEYKALQSKKQTWQRSRTNVKERR